MKRILVAILILVAVVPLYSADEQLEFKAFEKFADTIMKEWEAPGAAVAVVKDGKLIYTKGFGYRDVENKQPVTEDTIFAIGSCTKAFTGAALALLVEEGKLEWDRPIREYLPEFRMHEDYVSEHMTPRDLVTHRSGLPRHDAMWYGSPLSRKEMVQRLQYLEPNRGFRETFQYQNLMFMTAGYLVEHVSGQSWEDFTKQHLFDPLEMNRSNFSVLDSQKDKDFAFPYRKEEEQVKLIPFRNITAVGPAGSINSSVKEMSNWMIFQLGDGRFKDKQILSTAALLETHLPQIIISAPRQYKEVFYNSYALGWGVTAYRGEEMLTHTGGIDGFTAVVSLLPEKKIGVVVLSNMDGSYVPGILRMNLVDRFLGKEPIDWNQRFHEEAKKAEDTQAKLEKNGDPNRKLGTQPSHSLGEFAGAYENPAYGTINVILDGDQLKATYNDIPTSLSHYHYDVFQAADKLTYENMKFNFLMNGKAEVDKLSVPLEPAVADIVFKRVGESKMREREFVQKFVGEYDLAGTPVKVWLRGANTLMMTLPGQPDYELEPVRGSSFHLKDLEGYSVEFKSNEEIAITAVVITQPNGVFTATRKK
jgi:CubicO group peptidase (beta-lactamase class C family)